MTNEDAAKERDRIRQEANERTKKERSQSSRDRAEEVYRRNSEKKQRRESATNALTSGSADSKLAEIAKLGGSIGRKLEREIRQFQQTGRVSSWLAGETLKAEAAQNAAQQSAFRQQVLDVISSPSSSILLGPIAPPDKPLNRKPEIRAEGGAAATCVGLNLYVRVVEEDQEVWVGVGTVAGELPSGFNEATGKKIATSGSGLVWAEITINETTGEINSIDVERGTSVPNNPTKYHYELGSYEYSGNPTTATVSNYGCGSLDVTVCRNWFAGNPPFYGVAFSRQGSP